MPDKWHRQNLGNLAAGQLSANANPPPAQAAGLMYEMLSLDANIHLSDDEKVAMLERELLNIRRRREVMDAVEIPARNPFRPAATPAVLVPAPVAGPSKVTSAPKESARIDKGKERETDPSPQETRNRSPVAQEPLHPFAAQGENWYVPPQSRNLGATEKPKTGDTAYQTAAPIAEQNKSSKLFDRILDSNVTVSVGELCSVAPEIRTKFKEATTPKRHLAAYIEELDELEAFPVANKPLKSTLPCAAVAEDMFDSYLQKLAPGERVQRPLVARESEALRAITLTLAGKDQVEVIVDSGSQIVAMSEEVCLSMHLPYDPTVILNMVSANGTVDPSLGLAWNVPCEVEGITIYLQVHVIHDPAYDILLGCPFDVLTKSNVKTLSEDDTLLTITDPNTGQTLSIPTYKRGTGPRRPCKHHGDFQCGPRN
ncbi:hypothetical protein H0H81_003314 [Sphagnurus paluster]|uniref:Uncharacterized protein n=1 Tax=Sphagnurus paluster TaxID=117069 RepID=A0A9P7GM86_9AGAR|nr:hypothetical protein H0H81_003314 [Sphagnurus paluster]